MSLKQLTYWADLRETWRVGIKEFDTITYGA